jgi:hypothetical protein
MSIVKKMIKEFDLPDAPDIEVKLWPDTKILWVDMCIRQNGVKYWDVVCKSSVSGNLYILRFIQLPGGVPFYDRTIWS